MKPTRYLLSAIVLIGILLGGWFKCRAAAGGDNKSPSKTDLPADLDLVPRSALGFVHVRAADLWRSDWAKDIRFFVDNAGPEAWKAFVKNSPVDPATLERITLILMTPQALNDPFPRVDPEATSALVVISTNKPFDRVALIQALGSREKVYRHHLYYFNEALWSGLTVVDDRTFVVGSEEALVRFFEMSRQKGRSGPLDAGLSEAAGKHHVVVGLNPRLMGKEEKFRSVPGPLQKLLEAQAAVLTLDLDEGIRLNTRLDFLGEDKASAGKTAVRDTLEMARQGLSLPIGELDKVNWDPKKASPADLPQNFAALVALGFLRELDTILKEAPVTRTGATVQFPLAYKRLPSAPLFAPWISILGQNANTTFNTVGQRIGTSGPKDPVEEQLRTLAQALDKYRQKHGNYPPPAIYDRDGRPVLSWRVALLPFLGEETLYKSFKLDEPWDSLNNKRLLKKVPKILQSVNFAYDPSPSGKTMIQVFAGENAVFDSKKGIRQSEIARPAILLAHVASDVEVYWTKPADVVYAPDQPVPDVYGKYGTRIKVLMTDGTYRDIEKSMDEKSVRALIERSAQRSVKADRPEQHGDLEAIWNELIQNDNAGTKKAWQGIAAMSKTPERTVAFVKARVKAVPAPDPKRIAQCLADLDSTIFKKRVQAVTELEQFGELALAAIDEKLADKSISLEAHRHLEALAQKAKTVLSAEELRSVRAVEILEQIGSPEARAVLANLSRGGDGAVLTEQARRTLARLEQRSPMR
jgi:hypothetical protein